VARATIVQDGAGAGWSDRALTTRLRASGWDVLASSQSSVLFCRVRVYYIQFVYSIQLYSLFYYISIRFRAGLVTAARASAAAGAVAAAAAGHRGGGGGEREGVRELGARVAGLHIVQNSDEFGDFGQIHVPGPKFSSSLFGGCAAFLCHYYLLRT
jgi:hypothetical protein